MILKNDSYLNSNVYLRLKVASERAEQIDYENSVCFLLNGNIVFQEKTHHEYKLS